jgi:hypothetical protein
MKFMIKVRQSVLSAAVFVLVFGISDVQAFTRGDIEVYGLAERFTWEEFDDAGGRLLKESGPRFGVGVAYAHEFPNHLTLKPRIELNGGSVDYEGQACNVFGTCVPSSTETDYFGFKLEIDLGGKFGNSAKVEPFGGLGIRTWARDINDSYTSLGLAAGYTEQWMTFYGRVGLRVDADFFKGSRVFFEAGAKLPVYTENYIDDADVSAEAITLEPGNKPSLFAEAGVKLHRFKFSAFYDSMRFKKSPTVVVYDPSLPGYVAYHQPRSDADMFGLRIGASF